MTEHHPRRAEGKSKHGVSPKGFAFRALAALMVFGITFGLFAIDEIWSQIVVGIFIAVLIVPPLVVLLIWLVLRGEIANYQASLEREEERRQKVAAEMAERRARARQSYIGPDGLPKH